MTSAEQELAELLLKNRVLIHNLILGDADQMETVPSLQRDVDHRRKLAATIYELDVKITDEHLAGYRPLLLD